jgi:hypothetical protein
MKGAFLIPGEQESAIAFCDIGCYNVYTFYVDIKPMMGKKLKPNPNVCYYCIACGRRIYKTIDCMIHEDKCPDWLWYSSYTIMSDFLDIIEEETGSRDCSSQIYNIADRIAKVNNNISGLDLAMMTLDALS